VLLARLWDAAGSERKLEEFRQYYNAHHVHTTLGSNTPSEIWRETIIHRTDLNQLRWKSLPQAIPVASNHLNNTSPHTLNSAHKQAFAPTGTASRILLAR